MDRPVRHARSPGPRLPLVLGCGIAAVLAVAIVALVVAGANGGGGDAQGAVAIERLPETATAVSMVATATRTSTSTVEPTAPPQEEEGDLAPTGIEVAGEEAVPAVEIEATATPAPAAPPAPAQSAQPPPAPTGSLAGVSIYANGDSTSYFMSAGLLQMATAAGAVQVQPAAEYHQSSGLSTPSFFDWYGYMTSEIALYNPQVVVFMVGANEAWLEPETYRPYVARMMDQLQDRRLVWVGQPNMGREDLAANLPGINAVFQQEAAKRPWVRFVDTWAITSDANGAYTPYLPDADGNLVLARGDDGVHFTSAGGYVLARAVLAAILGG